MVVPAMAVSANMISTLLGVVEHAIVPVTREGVAAGSPLFGAAVLSRPGLGVFTVASANQRVSPPLHGELNCIQQFFTSTFPDPACRPDPRRDTVFLSTHEPCSLCLSALAWAGFAEFYFLFRYEETRDLFGFPDNINILERVFHAGANDTRGGGRPRQFYSADNDFFTGRCLVDMVRDVDDAAERARLADETDRVKLLYRDLHVTYLRASKSLDGDRARATERSGCSISC